jgi:hypothetical protein
LNALESLSDIYAVICDWDNVIYTANHVIEVYEVLLKALKENANNININEDTIITDTLKSPLIIEKPTSSMILKKSVSTVFRHNSASSEREKVEKNSYVLNLRRGKLITILSKGHMIKNSLNNDTTQNNISGGDKHDIESNISRFQSSSDMHVRDSLYNVSINNVQKVSNAVDLISVLWNEAAIEFEDLNEYQQSLSIYKVLATLWGESAEFQQYSRQLIDFNCRLLQQKKDSEASHFASYTPDSRLNITYGSLFPLQPKNANDVIQIDAAKKQCVAWKNAARIAQKICDEYEIKKMREANLELTLRNQVIFCKYNAGLSAMVYDISIAQSEFESAQNSKAKYDELAGSLVVDLPDVQAIHQNDIDSSAVIRLSKEPRRKKKILQSPQQRQQWVAYNTLCCDISYHLGHTYLVAQRELRQKLERTKDGIVSYSLI